MSRNRLSGNRMRLAVMAWRNLWRYGRRTLTTIAAMTLALVTLIVWTSFVQGFLRDLETTIVEVEVGDIQVYPPEYRNSPSMFDRIGTPAELVDTLGAMGFHASARLLGGGLAAAGDASAGVSLRGVETGQDARVSVRPRTGGRRKLAGPRRPRRDRDRWQAGENSGGGFG